MFVHLVNVSFDLEVFLPDAVRFVPVQLGSTDERAAQSNRRHALQFTPSSRAIALHQTPQIADAGSGRDDIDLLDAVRISKSWSIVATAAILLVVAGSL